MLAHPAFSVPPARGGEISDKVLDEVIDAFGRMTSGDGYTEADGALLSLTIAPLLAECRDHRAKAGMFRSLTLPDNVVMLRGAN